MLKALPPPDVATAPAPFHSACGNKQLQLGWKTFAAFGRSCTEKHLPGLFLVLVFCLGSFCQVPSSRTPASSASLSPQVSHINPKAIAEDGQRALAEGRYTDAEQDFKQLLKLDKRSAPLYSNLGVVYLRTSRLDLAIDSLLKAEALAPGIPGIRLNLGLAYYRKNEFGQAASYFGEVLASDPSNRQARYLKGICNFMMDDFPAAIAAFEPLEAGEQNDLEYLFMLGTSYGMVKRTDDSARIFEQLVEVGGDTAHLHLLLGKAYLALSQQDKAAVELKRATENDALPFAHYYLGVLNRQLGRLDVASEEFEKEIGITPGNASAYKELAEIRLEQSNVQGAVTILEKGVASNPSSPELLATLARAYLEIPNQARAIVVLRKAITLDPTSGNYHYQLGRAYLKSGRHAEASAEMARARVLNSDASEAKMRALSKDQSTEAGTDERR